MKNIRFLPKNVHFLVVKFSIYLNRCVFVMSRDSDQKPRSAASDLGQHCLPVTRLGVFSHQRFVFLDFL